MGDKEENYRPAREDEEDDQSDEDTESDIHFEPLIQLPEVDVKTLEEDEEILWKARAKLYRFETQIEKEFGNSPQWKERGVGEVKFLQHKSRGCVRLVMRREQTLKVCANHYILPNMKLIPHNATNRSWIWTTMADFADEEPKQEMLAIRFKDAETCKDFQFQFENAKLLMEEYQKKFTSIRNKVRKEESGDAGENSVEKKREIEVEKTQGSLKVSEDLAKNVESLSIDSKNN